MSKFVFRNNTIERFFGKEYSFSGYADISIIPQDAEFYVWWYQVPIKYDQALLAEEIRGYARNLNFVLQQVDSGKTFVILTMDILYAVSFMDDDYRVQESVSDYNRALYEAEASNGNVKVIDITEFTRRYSAEELFDWKFYFISQMGMTPKLHKEFKAWFGRKLEGIALKRKKCLVLDLDNTLWGGVLGEEGIEGIQIGGDYPGKAFLYFQEALSQLSRSGVILAVCSKTMNGMCWRLGRKILSWFCGKTRLCLTGLIGLTRLRTSRNWQQNSIWDWIVLCLWMIIRQSVNW